MGVVEIVIVQWDRMKKLRKDDKDRPWGRPTHRIMETSRLFQYYRDGGSVINTGGMRGMMRMGFFERWDIL